MARPRDHLEFSCGFDIYPELYPEEDGEAYKKFVRNIVENYADVIDRHSLRSDEKVLELPEEATDPYEKKCITFKIGDCPQIPYDPEHCEYFVTFFSRVNDVYEPAKLYIKEVCNIAKKYFGNRVFFWHELNETEDGHQESCYDLKGKKLLEF